MYKNFGINNKAVLSEEDHKHIESARIIQKEIKNFKRRGTLKYEPDPEQETSTVKVASLVQRRKSVMRKETLLDKRVSRLEQAEKPIVFKVKMSNVDEMQQIQQNRKQLASSYSESAYEDVEMDPVVEEQIKTAKERLYSA